MMLYPPMAELVDKIGSRYLLVNLVARRARNIAQKAEETGEILDRKPISIALDEVDTGKLKLKEDNGEEEPAAEAEPETAEDAEAGETEDTETD